MFFKHRRTWKAEMDKLPPGCAEGDRAEKYYEAWRSSLKEGRSPMADEQPWLSFAAIELIGNFLKQDMKVFEFGGGGSTLFFSSRVAEVVTVEHDEKWFPMIGKAIEEKQRKNWKGILAPAETGGDASASPADPEAYVSDDKDYKGLQFRKYASAIDSYPDAYFDLVIVDGRARTSCLRHGILKVKPGGLLVLDNSDRGYYLEKTSALIATDFETLLDCAGPGPYLEWFTKTTIWRKK